jgi:hypothetical protein
VLLAAGAIALLLATGAGAGGGKVTTYRGRAGRTHDKVQVQVRSSGRLTFTYACRDPRQPYVYRGRVRRGRFHIVEHPRALRKVVVVDIRGRVSATRVRGTIQQDVCAGAVERFTARRSR